MQVKKIPMRSCVVTKEKLPKKELIRIVRTPEGNVIVDQSGKVNGRGAYIKLTMEVIDQAEKTHILDRHLETSVQAETYEELRKLLK